MEGKKKTWGEWQAIIAHAAYAERLAKIQTSFPTLLLPHGVSKENWWACENGFDLKDESRPGESRTQLCRVGYR